jgi:hypothetical protein
MQNAQSMSPSLVMRDPYVLDFLGLRDTWQESDLEAAIIREMESFLLELGASARDLRQHARADPATTSRPSGAVAPSGAAADDGLTRPRSRPSPNPPSSALHHRGAPADPRLEARPHPRTHARSPDHQSRTRSCGECPRRASRPPQVDRASACIAVRQSAPGGSA